MGSKSKTSMTNPIATQQYNNAVSSLGNSTYKPVTGADINSFMSPYTSSVVNANQAISNQNQQLALNQNHDNATRAGAFGGTGSDVADALTRGQYALADNASNAGVLENGYNTALQAALSQNQAQNQYPITIQALLGQLAGQTGSSTTTRTPFDLGSYLQATGSLAKTVAMG